MEHEYARSISRERKLLTFTRTSTANKTDIWVVPLTGGEAEPFATTPFDERSPSFSPNGRWIAYTSDESGTDEIYLRSWPPGGSKHQISVQGGKGARFTGDGTKLFFTNEGELNVVDVEGTDEIRVSLPRLAFPAAPFELLQQGRSYDLDPDGTSAVLVQASERLPNRDLHIVFDWVQSLNQ